jgi:hypothetical protein
MEQRLRLIQGGGVVSRTDKRAIDRVPMRVPAQIAWKDAHGRTQVASVTTADVSAQGVRIESRSSLSLPMYRLVYFQIDRGARTRRDLPEVLQKQTVQAAVFRVGPSSKVTGTPTEYALRLLVEPQQASGATCRPRRSRHTRTA